MHETADVSFWHHRVMATTGASTTWVASSASFGKVRPTNTPCRRQLGSEMWFGFEYDSAMPPKTTTIESIVITLKGFISLGAAKALGCSNNKNMSSY